jgi:threonine aldolase
MSPPSRYRVDLRSDTVSLPSHGMRNAMAHAEVGDDVYGEDPTVNALERRVASILGFGAAVLMPSGTMTNGVAMRTLASPGDEIVCGSGSHVYLFEGAQAALNGGMQMHRLDEGPGGCLDPAAVALALSRARDVHHAPRGLVCLENTHNTMGGLVLPEREVSSILETAAAHGVPVYLDGARLWHAAAVRCCRPADLCRGFSMVSVCFSKALGCPVGSVLAGPPERIERARWFRKRQGGAMRQAGILAAACIYALDNNLEALPRTHEWARALASAAALSPLLATDPSRVQTNIVIVDTPGLSAESVASALGSLGIGCLAMGPERLRMVTHLSLGERDVKYAADTLAAFGG